MNTVDLGKWLLEMRLDALLTQPELALRMDSNASVVCRIEKGTYGDHKWGTMMRFANGCGKKLVLRAEALEKPW